AVATTAVVWVASWGDIAPLWHIRYLAGVLPLLYWTTGGFWGVAMQVWSESDGAMSRRRLRIVSQWLVVVVAVVGLMIDRGTLSRLATGTIVLVRRGEDWRGAVEFVQQHRRSGEPVFVAAGLLESSALDR